MAVRAQFENSNEYVSLLKSTINPSPSPLVGPSLTFPFLQSRRLRPPNKLLRDRRSRRLGELLLRLRIRTPRRHPHLPRHYRRHPHRGPSDCRQQERSASAHNDYGSGVAAFAEYPPRCGQDPADRGETECVGECDLLQ